MQRLSVVALFCEDVREEKSGGETLIGIYPDNVNVPSIPCAFPKLALYVRINLNVEFDHPSLSLTLTMPDKTQVAVTQFERSLIDKALADARATGNPIAGLIGRVVSGNFPVPIPGRIVATVKVGDESIVAGSLNVQQTPKPA